MVGGCVGGVWIYPFGYQRPAREDDKIIGAVRLLRFVIPKFAMTGGGDWILNQVQNDRGGVPCIYEVM